MDQKDPSRSKMRITNKDTHPNEQGHKYMMEILLDGYKKNYSYVEIVLVNCGYEKKDSRT